ncbi:M56 family metallopeptidase [Akkermansiaceae bacterium]|nr:M56 family metallopeptidase [Akkermansiaceae bacterium]
MIATLAFSLIAAGLVLLAGRRDAARDPRLTLFLLILMALLPVMAASLPKVGLLPAANPSVAHFPWGKILIAVWVAGSAIFLARLAIAAAGLARWRNRSVMVDVIDGVQILEVDGLRGPVASGVLRKAVFVPQGWADWNASERGIVLRHELSHHERRDPLWRLCAELARAALWWNPLAHWMANRFHLQCEFACDEAVVREGTDAKTYARLLCGVADKQLHAPLALAMANPSSLQRRVVRMLTPCPRSGIFALAILGTLGAGAAFALSVAGPKAFPASEVELRLSADPFPGEKWARSF